jgi:hypothetical protein
MAIKAQGQTVATNPNRGSVSIRLPTSKETKCVMDAVTQLGANAKRYLYLNQETAIENA